MELSEFHLCFRKQNPSIYLSSFKKPPNTEMTNEFSVLQKPNWEIYTEPVSMMHYSLLLHICHIQHLEKSWVIARSPKCLSPISSGQNAQGGMGRGKFLHLSHSVGAAVTFHIIHWMVSSALAIYYLMSDHHPSFSTENKRGMSYCYICS